MECQLSSLCPKSKHRIYYIPKSYDSRTSINHVLYNTEIPNLTFVIKCLLHGYIMLSTPHVLFRYHILYENGRTYNVISSLINQRLFLIGITRVIGALMISYVYQSHRKHIFNFLNVFHKLRTTVV